MKPAIKHLGIYDSGLGGFAIYHDLKTRIPDLSLTLYADQKHAPYGNRTPEDLLTLAIHAIAWFENQGITDVLIACNTVSATVLTAVKQQFPTMRLWGIIDLTAQQLPNYQGEVVVFATQATCKTHAYQKALAAVNTHQVQEVMIPELVHYIEGNADAKAIAASIQTAFAQTHQPDVIILGCTHYPLVRDVFASMYKGRILDSQQPIYEFVKASYEPSVAHYRIVTSGDAKTMQAQIQTLFKREEQVES